MTFLARASVACLPFTLALACDPAPGDPPDAPNLEDRTFLSQSVTEAEIERPLVGEGPLRLEFFESPRVMASAGCNLMQGEYRIEQGELQLDNMFVTEIGCDAATHDQEDWYFAFLGSSPNIEVEGDLLVLDRNGTRIEYLDEEVATPDIDLIGPTWTVTTILDGQAASGADWPTPATLVFGEETVDISTGCNSGEGSYQLIGDTIEFAEVSLTKSTCDDELSAMLEAALLGVLLSGEPVSWEIDVNTLSLRRSDGSGVDLSGE